MPAPKGNKFALGCTTSGGPDKYKPEYCKQIVEFFNIPPCKIEIYEDNNGKPHLIVEPANYPTFEKFAFDISVCVDTLHEWKKVHKEFSESYTLALNLQKNILMTNGLNESYNSNFAKFVATNCHGMRDRTEIINTDEVIRTAKDIIQTALTYINKDKQKEFIDSCEKVLSEFSPN
jgi:hypothetical protein